MALRNTLVSAIALAALPATLVAQASFRFPMDPAGADIATGLATLSPLSGQIRDLQFHDVVLLEGLRLPSGADVSVQLERVRHERMNFGFRVDGEPADLLRGLDFSLWSGVVVGDSQSEVILSFSNKGSRGWLSTAGELVHFLPQPDASGDWSRGVSLLATEHELRELGLENDRQCGLDQLAPVAGTPTREERRDADVNIPQSGDGGNCNVLECKISVETDYQLNQVFNGDLGAETAYATALLGAASARYEEQIGTMLTYPYLQFYTTPNDPWSTPESGGSMIDMLNEFVPAWSGNIPNDGRIGHFLSGAGLGGGVAYLGVLCDSDEQFSFAVSGNIGGDTPFPVAVGPLNWDFMVFTHETGHNFDSPHTHDYNPQIDNCAGGSCITDGTIMSYCHQCPGGLANITTFFHPTVVGVMMAHAANCLDPVAPLLLTEQPNLVPESVSTTLSVQLLGTPTAGVDLNWRANSGAAYQVVAMSDQGSGTWSASSPVPQCGDTPDWFFSTVDAQCGPYQTDGSSAVVGAQVISQSDDFESNSGWTVGAPGDDASTGIWTLVDPNGTQAQPGDDHTDAGTMCFVTGQGSPGGSLGENDVDDGKTTLTSPVYDLSGGDASISYWRWYSNNTGASANNDVFEVEISNNGGASWTDVETVGPSGAGTGGGWNYHEFTVSELVAPTANVQLRFIASDEGQGSLVEAAIDDLTIFELVCQGTCQPDLGFGGPGASSLSLCGGDLSSGTSADLTLVNAASSAATFFVFSTQSNPTPLFGGTLVPFPADLILGKVTDASGEASIPGIPGGSALSITVNVQAVYLDFALSGDFGFSNAVEANFLP